MGYCMKYFLFVVCYCTIFLGYGQDNDTYKSKKVATNASFTIDSLGINPSYFKVLNGKGTAIDSLSYSVDYTRGVIQFSEILKKEQDSVTIEYLAYPSFLTKEYFILDSNIIVESTESADKLYALNQSNSKKKFTPFDGLNTVGSISRGVTVGNNQNAVVDSQLDLQITGKLNDKVSIRASIQDANIPTQQGGFSQNLDEFDQIFIELYADKWNIRAGDVDLQNQQSYFSRFTKKVQGISLRGQLSHENGATTSAFGAGAIVRGVFSQSSFMGQEGNQGPYKLVGPNGELFILIVSGSETVYVNGVPLKRGESEDYVIDYNAGEIKFNPTYPINATMRIRVDYQFTDRNYTRFIGYGGGEYKTDTFRLGTYVYSENDSKNQPLQQNLSEEQVAILQNAGDDRNAMTAPSAVEDTFSENKILYRKENTPDGTEIFVFSQNPDDTLFNVRFTNVGQGQGNYVISNENTISRVFEYVTPINGVLQGSFEPIIQLTAPVKLQIGGVNGSYAPSEKTAINFEISGSKNDLNLFSSIDDGDNNGFAAHVDIKQAITKTKDSTAINAYGKVDFVNEDFRSIERIYNLEFNRDWNNINSSGNQRYVVAGVEALNDSIGNLNYEFQHLGFSKNYTGVRQVINNNLRLKKYKSFTNASYLNTDADTINSSFLRLHHISAYSLKKGWVGAKISAENNQVAINNTQIVKDSLTALSQKFQQYTTFAGIGDSTKVFVEASYQYRVTDSVRNGRLARTNTINTYGLQSTLVKNTNTQLSVFANYRELNNVFTEDENSLNTRLQYNQGIFKNGIRLATVLGSNSGVIPQQDFTYLEVEPGQGFYTWNDYNENGLQELDEFEIAEFQDQASFIRILLPNQVFVKIRENTFSQSLVLNPKAWSSKKGFLKVLSHFYNQTAYSIDRKERREGNSFTINPFRDAGDNQLGLNSSFRNILYFNRGKQRYTTSYTYINTANTNLLQTGLQSRKITSHELNFTHKVKDVWLFNLKGNVAQSDNTNENFATRNFSLDSYAIDPKVTYLVNPQTRFTVFYNLGNKRNTTGIEVLDQQKLGAGFNFAKSDTVSINGEFTYIDNSFEGSSFSPVAYQILEGLQPGTNFTWQLLLQKKITKYLDLNLNYLGRDTQTSKTVHTGSVQLRAYF